MRLGSCAALIATIFLAACTGSMSYFQRALIWETGFSVTSAIAYGDGERQKLDIYTPRGAPLLDCALADL